MSVFAVVTFEGGRTHPFFFPLKVGHRTDDIIVVGWINGNSVTLPSGAQDYITGIMPPTGTSDSSFACNRLIGNLSTGDTTPNFTTLSAADRSYILHWMFKYAGNQDPLDAIPGGDFRDESNRYVSQAEVSTFVGTKTNYKLFNRLQAKFEVTPSGYKNTKIIHDSPAGIGDTKNPCGTLAGRLGIFPGQAGPNNNVMRNTATEVSVINDGSPDANAVIVFNVLMGKDLPPGQTPLFWENIGSAINFRLEGGQIVTPRIYVQPYPTYYIYRNGTIYETRLQSPSPLRHFYPNPYPFGTKECDHTYSTGTTPGGRCGGAHSPPEPTARVPDFIRQP